LNPDHKLASAARSTIETGCEFLEQCAGQCAVELLDGILDRGRVIGGKARLEEVGVVGAEGLCEDCGEGLA
jgi:hypothetical protein